MNRTLALLALWVGVALPATAQLPAPVDTPLIGARMPALSPDGSRLAFAWRGDIYVAPSTGGRGYPVTSHVEFDGYPVFSPDGNWIAFASMRNGNFDAYVVPATGGAARQITFASANEVPSGWSPDGKQLLFGAAYDTPNPGLFAVDVVTGGFAKLAEDYVTLGQPTVSPDGARVAFTRNGFPWYRPRYNGSAASQIWTLNRATGQRAPLTKDTRQHLFPRWTPDGKSLVCVTVGEETPQAPWLGKPLPKLVDSDKRTPNLWSFPAAGGRPRQLTKLVGGSVRFPTVAAKSGAIAFEWEQDLWLLAPGASEPRKIVLYAGGDSKVNEVQPLTITNAEVGEAEISPDGKTFLFLVRNDLWTIPLEKPKGRNADDATRLTDWVGFDRDFVWSKDGKTVFFISDRDGNDRVFALDIATRAVRPIWTGAQDTEGPQVSPDGKTLGFWVAGGTDVAGLYTVPVEGGTPQRVLAVPGAQQGGFRWSPDLQWIAYARSSVATGTFDIYIAKADGSAPVNVTRLGAQHLQPTWSPDGKYLFFTSNRDGDGLYVLPLQAEDARTDELEMTYQKPKAPVQVSIDFNDAAMRIRKLVAQQVGEIHINDDGLIVFSSGGDLFTSSYDGKTVTRLTQGGGIESLRLAGDGKTAYFRRNGQLQTSKLVLVPGAQPTQVTFAARWERNVRAERQAAFSQFWRSYNARFYDPNFHGRDWAAIRKRYEPMIAATGTGLEFAILLNQMVGELEASHAEVGPAPSTPSIPTRNLGVYFDYSHTGPGIKVASVPNRAPGSFAKTRIKPGEYIVAVDGKDVSLNESLFTVLADRGDRDATLLVNATPSREGARTVTYRLLTDGEWRAIHYRNKVEARRKQVETLSGGKIGYVHIAGMGLENQNTFEKEFFAWAEGKEAMIIDVRENGGGNIGDRLISWLTNKPYSFTVGRDNEVHVGAPQWAARTFPNLPMVVLMAETSFSNAEMFPYGMQATGLAKLVGKPTPGYVIWTGGLPLVDGTSARMPSDGTFRKDGSPLENMGQKPDFDIDLTPDDFLAGRDPQLEKAVSMLKK